MDIKDIQHLAAERIYLVPDASEGQLGYVWCDDPAPSEGMVASEAVEYIRKDAHDAIIARQASAARQGMDAAKRAGSHMEAEARRIIFGCSPEALESEREANAKLTELVAELERERDAYRAAEEMQVALRERVQEERDALSAYVERLKEAGEAAALEASAVTQAAIAWSDLCEQSPAASLVRRDLLKQAEVLEEIGHDEFSHRVDKPMLLRSAEQLRQRAQELGQQ